MSLVPRPPCWGLERSAHRPPQPTPPVTTAPAKSRIRAAAYLSGLALARPAKKTKHDAPCRFLLDTRMEGLAGQLIYEGDNAANH